MAKIPARNCPACGHGLNDASAAVPELLLRPPQPDDLMVCAYCAGILRFTQDLNLEVASEADIHPLRRPEYAMIRDRIRARRAQNN